MKKIQGCFCALLMALTLSISICVAGSIETFDIDLDLPPQDRWTHVVTKYEQPTRKVMDFILNEIPHELMPEIVAVTDLVEDFWPRSLQIRQEMQGISKLLDIPVGLILGMNLFYELHDGCTSIVAQSSNGTFWHGRNLDYDVPGLRDITVNVNFVKGGEILYRGTTYVGYIGIPTGMRPGAFSLSQDQRFTGGSLWNNLISWILNGGRAYSFLIRDLLENADDYDTALKSLQETPLIAPCYLIIAGIQEGQGAVVSRARASAVDTWTIYKSQQWFLVQTNDDHWKPPSDSRREAANNSMRRYDPESIGSGTMMSVMNTKPVLNQFTTYTTVMSARSDYFYSITQNENSSAPGRIPVSIRYNYELQN